VQSDREIRSNTRNHQDMWKLACFDQGKQAENTMAREIILYTFA